MAKSFVKSREGKTVLILTCLIIIIISTGIVRLEAPYKISPGGSVRNQNSLTIYLERSPDILGCWNKSASGGEYYVLSAWEGLAIMVLGIFIFSSFHGINHRAH